MPREELIEKVLSLPSLDWKLDVDPEDIEDAYLIIVKYRRLKSGEQHGKIIEANIEKEKFLRHLSPEIKRRLANRLKTEFKKILEYSIRKALFRPVKNTYIVLDYRDDIPVVYVYCSNCNQLVTAVDAVDLAEPTQISLKCPRCGQEVAAEVQVEISGLTEMVEKLVTRALMKYPWLRYAAFIPLFTKWSLVALVFDPPEVVYKKDIKCRGWADYFIPRKQKVKVRKGQEEIEKEIVHAPITAKFFYTLTRIKVAYYTVHIDKVRNQLKKMHASEKLIDWFENKYRQYLAKYRNKSQAIANTYRDLLRICELNTYLVYSYLAHREGKIHAVQLPYELAKMPGNASSYFNPVDTCHKMYTTTCSKLIGADLRQITWTWAVSTNGIKIG